MYAEWGILLFGMVLLLSESATKKELLLVELLSPELGLDAVYTGVEALAERVPIMGVRVILWACCDIGFGYEGLSISARLGNVKSQKIRKSGVELRRKLETIITIRLVRQSGIIRSCCRRTLETEQKG